MWTAHRGGLGDSPLRPTGTGVDRPRGAPPAADQPPSAGLSGAGHPRRPAAIPPRARARPTTQIHRGICGSGPNKERQDAVLLMTTLVRPE